MIDLSPEKLNVLCLLSFVSVTDQVKEFPDILVGKFFHFNSVPGVKIHRDVAALSKFEAFSGTVMAGPSRKERWATEIVKGRFRNVLSR